MIAGKKLIEEGKLQMPLYLLAARVFGLEPIGGLYSPLGATTEDRPRGLIDEGAQGHADPRRDRALNYGTDFLDPDEFEETLEAARERAAEIVDPMRAGAIAPRPARRRVPDLVRRWRRSAGSSAARRSSDPEAEEDEAT